MRIVLEFLTIWWISSSEVSEANSSEATWVKLPARRGCDFSGISRTALLSWFLTMVHQTAGFSSPGAAGASPLETCRTLGLQAGKLDQLCSHHAVEQTRVCSVWTGQSNGYWPWLRGYSHSAPWNSRQKNGFPDVILTLLDFQQLSKNSPWRDVWLHALLPGLLGV